MQTLVHETKRLGGNVKATVGEMELDQRGKQAVVRVPDPDDRSDRKSSLEVRELRSPCGRRLVRNQNKGLARVLGLVPGVEQLFLVALVGVIEHPPANAFDEGPSEQSAPRPARTGKDRRLDGPHAELAEMVERVAVCLADDEPLVAVALRPVERKRDLVGTLLHWPGGGWLGAALTGPPESAAGGACVGGGGIGGGLSESEWILMTDPEAASTVQPRPASAAASCAKAPLYLTRM